MSCSLCTRAVGYGEMLWQNRVSRWIGIYLIVMALLIGWVIHRFDDKYWDGGE